MLVSSEKTIRDVLRQALPYEPINCAHDGSETDLGLPREMGAQESEQAAAKGAPFGGAAAEPSVVDWRGFFFSSFFLGGAVAALAHFWV